jgi:hypothetical protein
VEIIRQEVEATGSATYVTEVTDSEGEEATATQTTLGGRRSQILKRKKQRLIRLL